MSKTMQRHQTPEEKELERKEEELRELEAEFTEKELTLATLRAELHHFEIRYIRQVGHLYSILDDLEAQIAEEVARQHPRNERARHVAEQARSKAHKPASEAAPADEAHVSGDEFKPSERLKALYRSAAKAIHPDLASNDADRARCHKAMASINEAYEEGDENRIRAIIEEWAASPESIKGEGTAAELVRVIRRISLIRKRLDNIKNEIEQLQNSSLGILKRKVDEGLAQGRDMLKEMAIGIQAEIKEAEMRLAQIRQSKNAKPSASADADKHDRLQEQITTIYDAYFDEVSENTIYTQQQNKILRGLLSCADLYTQSLFNHIRSDRKLSKFLDKKPNAIEAFLASCFVAVNDLNIRIENGFKIQENWDWVLTGFSNVIELEKDSLINFISQYQHFIKRGEDPRDLWLKQDLEFCKLILDKTFDIIHYYFNEHRDELLLFSLMSQKLRISLSDLFDNEIA